MTMTNKEKLNSILRLRLFFSTERELSELIGYNLKGNHFCRFKPFQCEAYLSKFAEECRKYTLGYINLERLLHQYEVTSKFFKQYIERTSHEKDKLFVHYLLNYLFLGKSSDSGTHRTKDLILCERYDALNTDGGMNIGILLLMTYGLLPTFYNKTVQDVPNIIGDFQKAYDLLLDIAQLHKEDASTKYKEMLCLKEMRQLIGEERQGDRYLNRLLLIHITNDVLNRIYALERPLMLKLINEETEPMDFELKRLWRCDDEADNVVWEFVPLNIDAYYLYRNEIDYQTKKIRYTRYQLMFKDVGYKDFSYTVIMQPVFNYNNMLELEQPDDSLSYDYTDIEYEKDNRTAKKLTFTLHSPIGDKPLVLKPIDDSKALHYYEMYLEHEGIAQEFEDVDKQPEYGINYEALDVGVTDAAIIFRFKNETYKLEKYDDNGEETISGIHVLTHQDNFILAELIYNGAVRQFLCLDSINQNLEFCELLTKPYFRKITDVNDFFG